MVRRDIDRRVPHVDATGVMPAARPAPARKGKKERHATNWEYHQDARDRAYAYAALMALGTLVLAMVGGAALIVLVLMQIWQP